MAPIHDACIRGDVEEVQRILHDLDNPQVLLASKNEAGFNAYVLAFTHKQHDVMQLISKHVSWFEIFVLLQDVSQQLKLDCSIHDVIENAFLEEFQENHICDTIVTLLNQNVNVNSRNSTYLDTPLHLACRYKMKLVMNLLLENGADVQCVNRDLKQPIHELCNINGNENHNDFADMLTTLIKYGAKLDATDAQQHTPFDIILQQQYCENIKNAFTDVMIRTVINLKQSLETTKKENNLTPQVQSLLIHASIAIKQLENLETIKQA